MKSAICHYSFNRRYVAEKWTPDRLAKEVKALGVDGVDFLTRMMDSIDTAAEQINRAVSDNRVILSSLSMSTNFNQPKAADFAAEVASLTKWLDVAVKTKAPICRIFGGKLSQEERANAAKQNAAWQRMLDGLAEVTKEAAKRGVVLALENHGGLPCLAEQQVEVIKAIDSPALRATVDVGNYHAGGQDGHVSAAIVAPYAAYVHFKDNKKVADSASPWGWQEVPCALGEGDVDLIACMAVLKKAGYNGYVALEYEGDEDEATAVPRSVEVLKRLVN